MGRSLFGGRAGSAYAGWECSPDPAQKPRPPQRLDSILPAHAPQSARPGTCAPLPGCKGVKVPKSDSGKKSQPYEVGVEL